MIEQILSPGVYSYENDQSYVPPGQSATGLAIVGPTEKGEAFVPTDVTSYSDFVAKFGVGASTYVPQTAYYYLQAGTTAKITRVLGNGGWKFNGTKTVAAVVVPPTVTSPGSASYIDIPTSSIFSTLNLGGGLYYPNGSVVVDGATIIQFEGYPDSSLDTNYMYWGNATQRYYNSSGSNREEVMAGLVRGINYWSSSLNVRATYTSGTGYVRLTTLDNSVTYNTTYRVIAAGYNIQGVPYFSSSFQSGSNPTVAAAGKILTVFHPSKTAAPNAASLHGSTAVGTYGNFVLTLSGSGVYKATTASYTVSSTNYLTKVVGTDENFEQDSAYPYLHFANYFTSNVSASSAVSMSINTTAITFTSSYAEGYDSAKTPWVLSEGGVRLFRFVHRSHGTKTNKDIKVSIANIKVPTGDDLYTTFDILVRKYSDTDTLPSILEQYTQVTLNPDSANYIGNIIGDKYREYDSALGKVVESGDYVNISNYIRVETTDGVKNKSINNKVKPAGFEALYEPIAGFVNVYLPSASYVSSNSGSGTYSGFNYSNTDNLNYLNPIPQEANTGSNANFTLPSNDNKFTLPFQRGTDGMNFATIRKIGEDIAADGTNVFGYDLSSANAAGTSAYQKAFDILANNEEYSFDLLAVPGVLEQYHSSVTALAESLCEERTDAIYIRDLTGLNASVTAAANETAGLDSSYSATYYPWVKVKDINSPKDIFVPPSVLVPQAIAYNDRIGAEWYAPAGLNRGVVGGAIDTKNRLSKAERDVLYEARVNPITKFPNTGVVIYGQKTLQVRSTALDRVNVRRLLIALRRYISDVAKGLVFEQNTLQTRNRFLSTVNPYLESVQNRQGLYAYRVVMDETNNTADVIDRNQLVGKIYLQPTKTAEYIILEYNIQPTGVTFA